MLPALIQAFMRRRAVMAGARAGGIARPVGVPAIDVQKINPYDFGTIPRPSINLDSELIKTWQKRVPFDSTLLDTLSR